MFWRKKPEPPPAPPPLPETTAEVIRVVAQAPLFNPSDEDHLKAAAYRADAIARDFEQRRSEAREAHPDQLQMVGEAMSHAWRLFGAGKWTREDVSGLANRLRGR